MPLTQTEVDQYNNWRKIMRNTIIVAEAKGYLAAIEPAKALLMYVDRQCQAIQRGTLDKADRQAKRERDRRVAQVIALMRLAGA